MPLHFEIFGAAYAILAQMLWLTNLIGAIHSSNMIGLASKFEQPADVQRLSLFAMSAARCVGYCGNLQTLSAGCKALLAVLLSTPSGVAYLVQQHEASQSLITALQTR